MFAAFAMPLRANAEPSLGKVFALTSTYGVMAGTLMGFATLAFYEDPSPHLKNVAIGVSLGLYTGIFLGLYAVYLKPDPNAPAETPEEEAKLEDSFHLLPVFSSDSSGKSLGLALSMRF